MNLKLLRRLSALSAAAIFLLPSCAFFEKEPDDGSRILTWGTRSGYVDFLDLAEDTYPDIELEYSTYAGANPVSYSWAQMRADDIPDIFITSRVLDADLAREKLADLSGYDFADDISGSVLDPAVNDGGTYLLPVCNTLYGIYYNKTLMEENGWEIPTDIDELETLCIQIQNKGMTPGLICTKTTDDPFSAVFNIAKTGWLSTPEGAKWEQDFLSGSATASGMWESTMEDIQRYLNMGMFSADPQDRSNTELLQEELGQRKAVFCTSMLTTVSTDLPNGDELGMMPYISKDGSKNAYIYNPYGYIGISSRLTRPGNEKKLENAVKLLSLLYSPEGQAAFTTERTPYILSPLDDADIPEDTLLYDAWQAQRQGRVFPMTYTGWENVLFDMGQVYKEWFRGEEGIDGPAAITLMDELQASYLNHSDNIDLNVCEVTDNFSLEETAVLSGKVLGSAVGADAAMIPIASVYKKGEGLRAGISGKLYKGTLDVDGILAISPSYDGEYAILTMTGAQANDLVETGFHSGGKGEPYPYILVTKGGGKLEDDKTYQVAFLMESYTRETGELYHAQVEEGSFRTFMREWMKEQGSVSPDGNPWE